MITDQTSLGIVFGTFAPLHKGHQSLITQALTDNQNVLLIVCGSKKDRGHDIGLNFDFRYQLIQEEYATEDKLVIKQLDQTTLPLFPLGESKWLHRFQKIMSPLTTENTQITIYFGEDDYYTPLNNAFPKATLVLADRQKINLSATAIRQKPFDYSHLIATSFRKKWLPLL